MLNVFLCWQISTRRNPDPEAVATRLQALFAPIVNEPLTVRIRKDAATSMVFLYREPKGWKPRSFEECGDSWAATTDYPLGARHELASRGIRVGANDVLLRLGCELEDDPVPLLNALPPPFALMWSGRNNGTTFIQNDGLGLAQLFECRHDGEWAVSNRLLAFRALGIPLEPVPEQWAARWALGWFPLDMSGYQSIRFIAPATRIHVTKDDVRKTSHTVLQDWLSTENLSFDDALELARTSLLGYVRSISSDWERPKFSFSGGRDSRTIAAVLLACGVDFEASVTGLPGNPDVDVAVRLAQIAGFDLKVNTTGGLPPDDPDTCRLNILLNLAWEGGYRLTRKHSIFHHRTKSRTGRTRSGRVRVTGKHGEIGRAFYWKNWPLLLEAKPEDLKHIDDLFIERILKHLPKFTRAELIVPVRDIITEAVRQADAYDLHGLARLTFFYLFERNRRFQSTSHSGKSSLIVTPFLNPGFIRVANALPPNLLIEDLLQKHVTHTLAPQWADVPFATGVAAPISAAESQPDTPTDWRQPVGNRNFHKLLYWQTAARPLLEECLGRDGFWTEVFDPDMARKHWTDSPDALVITSLLPEVLSNEFLQTALH